MAKTIGNYIAYFRGIAGEGGYEGETWDDVYETLESVGDVIYKATGDHGRWSYMQQRVFEVKNEGEVAWFKITEEVPATEIQDSEDYYYSMTEVHPAEKTVTVYE